MAQVRTQTDGELLARAAAWPGDTDWSSLTAARLRQLAAVEGIDFATAILYDRLLRSAEHGPFIRKLDRQSCTKELRVHVVIVPGAFYVESPHTGADGRLVREEALRLGCTTELVPIDSFGNPHKNAAILAEHLQRGRRDDTVLVSLSKGGLEVRLALELPDAEQVFAGVYGWVDLAGMVFGTPLAGWLLSRPWRTLLMRALFRWKGYDFAVVRELDRRDDASLRGRLRLPPHLRSIHVVGFPRTESLSTRLSRRGHRRLSPLGPNDGAVLLGDIHRLPGSIYPVWGADHYLRPAGRDLRPLVGRILHSITESSHPAVLPVFVPDFQENGRR